MALNSPAQSAAPAGNNPMLCTTSSACTRRAILSSAALGLRTQVRGYVLVFVPTIREIRDLYREM
eukprot:SAG31_NODE_2152_length_6315_cov_6.487452_6_plen_65_part_00